VGRHIPVHELEGFAEGVFELVGGVEPREGVDHDARGDPEGDALLLDARALDEGRELVALDVLHHQVEGLFVAHVERGHHVGVVDARREAGLVEEHPRELFVAAQVREADLHRHEALEVRRAARAAEVHRGHAALGDLVEHLVATQPLGLDHPRAGVLRGGHGRAAHNGPSLCGATGAPCKRR
jgi:hypothetical protein